MKLTVRKEWSKDLNNIPHGLIYGALFSGDRFSCCDEAICGYIGNQFIGIATISPYGESYDGTPEIVGLYVTRDFRRQGYGLQILSGAIERCVERHFASVKIIALSSDVRGLCDRLPEHLKSRVRFLDASTGLILNG